MESTPDDAYRLHDTAERWQDLAMRQQELGMQLRMLAGQQRELTRSWEATKADELAAEAKRIEEGLHALSVQVLGLQRAALDRMARTIAEEARALRPE